MGRVAHTLDAMGSRKETIMSAAVMKAGMARCLLLAHREFCKQQKSNLMIRRTHGTPY
jgi:hypothetical protein